MTDKRTSPMSVTDLLLRELENPHVMVPEGTPPGEKLIALVNGLESLCKRAAAALRRSSAESADAIEARDRYKKMYNAEVKAAAESKARCNEALGWSEQQLQAAKSSREGQLRNTIAFKAEAEAAEARLAEAVEVIRPFAEIADFVAEHHGGWDHNGFVLKSDPPMKLEPFRNAAVFLRRVGGAR